MQRDYTAEANAAIVQLGINMNEQSFTVDDLARGIKVEYEHGTVNPLTNVTNDDPIMTAKIALAHLFEEKDKYRNSSYDKITKEHPKPLQQYDYYDGLEMVEESPPGFWRSVSGKSVMIGILIVVLLLLIFALSSNFPLGIKLITVILLVVAGYFSYTILGKM